MKLLRSRVEPQLPLEGRSGLKPISGLVLPINICSPIRLEVSSASVLLPAYGFWYTAIVLYQVGGLTMRLASASTCSEALEIFLYPIHIRYPYITHQNKSGCKLRSNLPLSRGQGYLQLGNTMAVKVPVGVHQSRGYNYSRLDGSSSTPVAGTRTGGPTPKQ